MNEDMFRHEFPEQLVFNCEQVKMMMPCISGSPPNYDPETRKEFGDASTQIMSPVQLANRAGIK